MSQQRVLLLRNGLVAACALAAIIVLASFYSIVNGAVERAARQRLAIAETAGLTQAALASPPSLAARARAPGRVARARRQLTSCRALGAARLDSP